MFRRPVRLSIAGLFAFLAGPANPVTPLMAAAPTKPNIIVVMLDDLDLASMKRAVSAGFMPNVKTNLIDKGFTFTNFYASDALCCPSRATFFTGQYAHNHGVTDNSDPWNIVALRDQSTLPVWLQAAGYRTALVGKYLNGLGQADVNHDGKIDVADETYIPPGWNEWVVLSKNTTIQYGYRLAANGQVRTYGTTERDYQTDVLRSRAVSFVQATTTPFFLEVTPSTPHVETNASNWPPASYADLWKMTIRPAPRHAGTVNLALNRSAAFNETDISDKGWINPVNIPLLSDTDIANLQAKYNDRIGAMRAVDDLVGSLLQAVKTKGQWNNTVIMFTSDNGILLGEHRLTEKFVLYDEAIHIPLYIRQLWQTTPKTVDALVSMNDMAPSIAEWAGATPTISVDGTSFLPLLANPATPWRLRVGVEHWDHDSPASPFYIPEYHGVRTASTDTMTPNMVYAQYVDSSEEFYDLVADPNELQNLAGSTVQGRISQRLTLQGEAAGLSTCVGTGCHDLEFHYQVSAK